MSSVSKEWGGFSSPGTTISIQKALLFALLISSLTMGIWQAAGIPLGYVKAIAETSILALLFMAFSDGINRQAIIPISLLLGVMLIGVSGALFSGEGQLGALLFTRDLMKCVVLIPILASLKHKDYLMKQALLLGVAILFIQPPFAVFKFFLVGIDEKHWIGTMHQTAGELGVLAPLIAVAILIPLAVTRSLWWTALIAGFCAFAIVGEKRLAFLALPASMVGMFVLHVIQDFWRSRKTGLKLSSFKRKSLLLIIIITLSAIVIYSAARTIPSLNKEEKVGGDINVEYILSYHKEYLSRPYEHALNNPIENISVDHGIQLGRFRLIANSSEYMIKQPLGTRLFGFGGADINTSYILGENRRDIMFKKHGLRGPTPYSLRILFATGFVGLALFASWFIYIGFQLLRLIPSANASTSTLAVIAFGMNCAIFFDCMIYSYASWTYGVLTPLYFLTLAYTLYGNHNLTPPSWITPSPQIKKESG